MGGNNVILQFIIISFLFPVKIFGYDLRLIAYLILTFGILIGIITGKDKVYNKNIIAISFVFVTYTFVSISFHINFEVFVVQRTLRFFLSNVLLITYFSFNEFEYREIEKCIENAILLHIVVIYIELIYPTSKLLIKNILGFRSPILPLRCYGLSDGYDSAGFLINIYYLINVIKNKRTRLIVLLYTTIACFFVSRFSLLINILLAIYYFLSNINKKRAIIELIVILFLCAGLIPVFRQIMQSIQYLDSYAFSTIDLLLHGMIVFPDSLSSLMFGVSVRPNVYGKPSDIGYINIIFMYGVVGLIIIIFYYLLIIRKSIIGPKSEKNTALYYSALLMFIFNYKILVMSSSIFTELLLFILLSRGDYEQFDQRL
jgi:hypothetical protein